MKIKGNNNKNNNIIMFSPLALYTLWHEKNNNMQYQGDIFSINFDIGLCGKDHVSEVVCPFPLLC